MRVFTTFFTLILLLYSGCYNNAHVRTQKRLEEGERAVSFGVISAVGGPKPGNINYSGISGLRTEASFLKGTGKGEKGLYLGVGLAGSDGMDYIAGLESKKYITLSGKTLCKFGVQGEIDYSHASYMGSKGVSFQLRPSLSNMVTDKRNTYYGIHGLLSYGSIEERYNKWGYGDEINKYKLSTIGIGVSVGMERILKKTSHQYQYDISVIKSFLPDNNSKSETSIMISFSVGLNSFSKPVAAYKQSGQTYEISPVPKNEEVEFDPETGLPVKEGEIKEKIPIFDPETGKYISGEKPDTTKILFDPNTGEIIKDSTVSTCDTSKLGDIQEKAEENEYILDPTTGKFVKKSEMVVQITEAQVIMKAMNDAKSNHSQILNVGCGAAGCLYPLLGIPAGILYAESNIFPTIDLESAYVQQLNPDLRKRYIKTYKVEQRRLRRSAVYGTQGAISIVALIFILTLI